MTPEEQKRLRRQALLQLGIFIGVKAGLAYLMYRVNKSISETDIAPEPDDLEWFTNPYTLKISDGSLGGLVKVSFER